MTAQSSALYRLHLSIMDDPIMDIMPDPLAVGPHDRPVAHLSDHQLQAAWFWCLIDQDPLPRHRQILDELSRRQMLPDPETRA